MNKHCRKNDKWQLILFWISVENFRMRFKYIYIIILLGLYSSLFSQVNLSQLRVQYLVEFRTDTADVHTEEKEICDLLIGHNSSIFRSHQKEIIDSLDNIAFATAKENAEGILMITGLGPRENFRPEAYKVDSVLYLYNTLLHRTFMFEWKKPINWTITTETKTIEEYLCRKATAHYLGRDYEAWFTEDIPIQEGPYFFKGLPGLILEVYDTKKYYHFSLASIAKVEKPIHTNIKNPIVTTYEKFLKARNDFFLDPIEHLSPKYRELTTKQEQDERAKQLKRYNNFMN